MMHNPYESPSTIPEPLSDREIQRNMLIFAALISGCILTNQAMHNYGIAIHTTVQRFADVLRKP